MSEIYVIGSMSVDLVTEVKRAPKKGETLLGDRFFMTTGGKGANQAVAAARLGASVHMVGCVGDDEFGKMILDNLIKEQIQVNHVETIPHCTSGTASIMLADQDNSIVVVPGANYKVSVEQVRQVLDEITAEDIVLLQNEIPLEVIEFVINECHKRQLRLVYNPAPFIPLDTELLNKVTYFTPNETEVEELFGTSYKDLLQQYRRQMIVTLGEKGATYFDEEMVTVPAHLQKVVDTTGAGDTFNGALAVAISENMSLSEAVAFGNQAAGLSVTALGAQGGMPHRKDMIECIVQEH
ncbi:ribokinase [Macrococcus bovicus]|uniref:Ribokinase n=1 Tax=Macrococcus bovicus TaxID=69968 RepID=A0A4R6BZZ4_9STAP|nr:ribokinase [Macrococcus bovicus]TDM14333.1 ribokinase [Macrococcus bovicus]